MKRPLLIFLCLAALSSMLQAEPVKKVYMTYILHGNMNYDRYVRPTIWKEFPVIYDGLLDYLDEHPDFKGQLQFSGQTFGSLIQTAPEVIEHARRIHARGQLNFTGTFYSEPVNVNMDGETNYRCAWLGTKIIEDNIGPTDGFYLQERAYHPQLPWILNHSNVSWTPVITNDNSYYPFRLKGLDGSTSVCVPVTRGDFRPVVEKAPNNALIAIEEDYEIPQTFTKAYKRAEEFNNTHDKIKIVWITVKEYIEKFGLKGEKYVDHACKADSPEKGTYSRWTVDPLDIIVQHHTNEAMSRFRLANMLDAIARHSFGKTFDKSFANSGITLDHDPLVWNIERAELYPEHEKYLMRDSVMTVLSKAEQLLLWAVNSDSKGWFPLYEKRRERLNSLDNSIHLSESVVGNAVRALSKSLKPLDYDAYYVVMNMEAARKCCVNIGCAQAYEAFSAFSGEKLRSIAKTDGSDYTITVEVQLPAYGYEVIGMRKTEPSVEKWVAGTSVSNHTMNLSVEADTLLIRTPAQSYKIYMNPFMLKALAHMDKGDGDGEWRSAKPYGERRVTVCTDGLYPRLRIESQLDWLVHLQQTWCLMDDRISCDMNFEFPHPVVIRKNGNDKKKDNFYPQGLDLVFDFGKACTLGYDIPFGISELSRKELSYFCPLSSAFAQFTDGNGFMVAPLTGEQAFSADPSAGRMTLYLGASTTSGPIRDVGMKMTDKTTVIHEQEWYAEPFHGAYKHSFTILPYEGTWQNAGIPVKMRSVQQKPYVKQLSPEAACEGLPYRKSLIEAVPDNIEISTAVIEGGNLLLRLNEKEGRKTAFEISVCGEKHKGIIKPFGIVTQ